ncbi:MULTISPECIES: type II toxin-antitoxin system RatA family toxin [Ramlibacter]|uniref:Type II toxin-antitoxin system RatA family toxin n=1 Tax=Ramlibacter aquaticus TaxID=2780094 RepID=A0ABR9SFR8_9BURK|nr:MULTISPECIES: type II toxin-antitoxin system RatA family toxin [Ramlibacter]MBE7941200.1 type II toxin-antitoxin system RatA family toxin [Ramlibacter aquaticus]
MKTVHKSVLIWYSASQMFELVTDVARYPEFLPWCDRARVLAETGDEMRAEVGIAFGGIRQTFTTQNQHLEGREVRMALVDGPFSRLDGQWRFSPVGESADEACRVELELHYGFDNMALSALVGPVFDKIAGSLVDAFVKRAEQVYG